MQEFTLKYGCNPSQKPAKIFMKDPDRELPLQILNGQPGYINFLDALNSYQLVKELKACFNLPAAASFKHVSPTSAALGLSLSKELKAACFINDSVDLDSSPLACAYTRARGTDRLCSFGDWVALSDECDSLTATLIKQEVSDGIIAPGYSEEALAILKSKRGGNYNIVQIDPDYEPAALEVKDVYGISFLQARNNLCINKDLLQEIVTENKNLPESAARDLLVALITLKYTQSNSVCYAYDGQAIGVGAGQQSRIHCTRLAGGKADLWFLRQSELVLNLPFKAELPRVAKDNVVAAYIQPEEEDVCADGIWQRYFTEQPVRFTPEMQRAYLAGIKGVSLASDAFFPFSDNILRAVKSGVSYIAQPGGSTRDKEVIDCCDEYGLCMAFIKERLFHH